MIVLDTHLARYEIDRRLRAADHHRRSLWGRVELKTRRAASWPGTSDRAANRAAHRSV